MPFEAPFRPGRRQLLSLGLGALALPVLAACNNAGTPPPVTGTPRVSAGPGSPGTASPGVSGSPSGSVAPTAAPIKASNNLDGIKVEGKVNTQPKVTVPKPWGIDKMRVKVLSPGTGAVIAKAAPVTMQYYGVNGRSGEMFDSSWTNNDAKPITFSLDGVVPGFGNGLEGQRAGSRVVIAFPGKDGYDSQGGRPPQILVGDTLIFVVDIHSTVLAGPEGAAVAPVDGLPTVKDAKGVPTITIPKGNPPAELKIQPLIKGKGATVAETDTVHLHYRGAVWDGGKVVDDNFGKTPATTPLNDNTLIAGFSKGIIGQTVGSRVLLVIPPAEGYPEGNEKPKVPKGATLVYVVDILFAQAPQSQ